MKAEGLPVVPVPGTSLAGHFAPLVLIPGRLYLATILERDGNQALVSIGGHRFTAEVLGQLPTGGRVPVTVREASSERIVLQQAPDQPISHSGVALEASDLAGILQRIGLPPKAEYLLCLPHMLQAGQPITPEAMDELYNAWLQLADTDPAALPVLAHLQAHGLPLIDETLAAARHWETARALVTAESLLQLGQKLANLGHNLESEALHHQLEPLPSFLRSFARSLADLPLLHASDPSLPGHLASLVETLATPLEALLARLPASFASQPAPAAGAEPRTFNGADGNVDANLHPPASNALQPVPANPDSTDAEPAPILLHNPGTLRQEIPALERNVSVQLRRLSVMLDRLSEHSESLSTSSREAIARAQSSLREVIQSLDTQQIANLRSTPDSTVPHYYSFSIPIAWSGPADQASLRIYYRPGRNRRVDPQDTHLAFHLTVQRLGTIDVDLRVFRRAIACEVRTDNTFANQLALEEAPSLQISLQRLGYQVLPIRCAIRPSDAAQPSTGLTGAEIPQVPPQVNVVA